MKDADIIDFFCQLGEVDLTDDLHRKAEIFVCKMYGHKRITSVNELRSNMFWSRLRKNDNVPDLSLLPPCFASPRKHTSRAHYVASI